VQDNGEGQGLTIRGGGYQRKPGGPFLIRVARIFSGVHFSSPPQKKVDDLSFLVVVVTFKPTPNVQTSMQPGKNLAVDRGGGLAVGAPSNGTTVKEFSPKILQLYII